MFVSSLPETRLIGGVKIELLMTGAGQDLLFLHAGHGFEADDPLIGLLAQHFRVIAASHPGFGASERPGSLTTVDDLAYFYLDLIETMNLTNLIVVGVSLGGWIAAELATKGTGRIAKLVLIDAVGVKFSGRETRDIADIFATTLEEIPTLFFHDKDKAMVHLAGLDFKNLPLEAATRFARNRESLLLFGWSPTLYNPKLLGRLHRVQVPVLVLWGAEDKIVSPDYGNKLAEAFADGSFAVIADAGHYGYLEQPAAYGAKALEFLGVQELAAV